MAGFEGETRSGEQRAIGHEATADTPVLAVEGEGAHRAASGTVTVFGQSGDAAGPADRQGQAGRHAARQ
jgi:hypothetical protein